MTIPRIGITPRAALHYEVLQLWADIEGRSMADVCLTLLENGLRQAARQGDMPQLCIDHLRSPSDQQPEA